MKTILSDSLTVLLTLLALGAIAFAIIPGLAGVVPVIAIFSLLFLAVVLTEKRVGMAPVLLVLFILTVWAWL